MTRIKICGITNLADARYAAGAGADLLGFVLHPDSPRYVDAPFIAEMLEWLHGPETVGVFVNLDPSDVNRLADQAGFDRVQLHGEESPEDCAAIERPVIKAVRITPEGTNGAFPGPAVSSAEALSEFVDRYRDHVDHFLFDTWDARQAGGTGQAFDRTILRAIPPDVDWFLSGGLTPESVEGLVRAYHPTGVDVSSGVEEKPGVKDFDRIDDFIARVHGAISR